jgi:hypothetical protein
MKKLITFITSILILVLICTAFGPHLVLALARQPETESHTFSDKFFTTYDDVRENLDDLVSKLKSKNIEVVKSEFAVNAEEGLYIDNIYLPSSGEKTNLIVITTGVHGIEGYI